VILSADLIDQPSFTHLNEEKIPFRGGAFTLSRFFFEERKALSPRALLEQSSIPRYLFYGSNDTKVKEAAVCLEKIGVIPFEFKGVDHLFESYIIRLEMIRSLTHLIQEHIYGTQQPPDSLSHYEKRGPLSSQVH
jgi:hypothetical protein